MRIRWPERIAVQSPTCIVVVKNDWSYTSTPVANAWIRLTVRLKNTKIRGT